MKIISKKCIIPIIGNCAISSSGDYEKFNIVRKKNSVDIPHMYEKARQLKGQVPGEHGIGLVKQPYFEEYMRRKNLLANNEIGLKYKTVLGQRPLLEIPKTQIFR